jgi:hypothetical protein
MTLTSGFSYIEGTNFHDEIHHFREGRTITLNIKGILTSQMIWKYFSEKYVE